MTSRDVPTAPSHAAQRISRWLVMRSARSAPASLAERLEEEWLADMAARRGEMARIRFALGCCWATRVIAHEYLAPSLAAAGSSVGAAFGHRNSFPFSRRSGTLLLIVGVHAALIYGFATAFKHHLAPAGSKGDARDLHRQGAVAHCSSATYKARSWRPHVQTSRRAARVSVPAGHRRRHDRRTQC